MTEPTGGIPGPPTHRRHTVGELARMRDKREISLATVLRALGVEDHSWEDLVAELAAAEKEYRAKRRCRGCGHDNHTPFNCAGSVPTGGQAVTSCLCVHAPRPYPPEAHLGPNFSREIRGTFKLTPDEDMLTRALHAVLDPPGTAVDASCDDRARAMVVNLREWGWRLTNEPALTEERLAEALFLSKGVPGNRSERLLRRATKMLSILRGRP